MKTPPPKEERTEVQRHVTKALYDAPKWDYPMPHFYALGVFPDDTYARIQAMLADKTDYEGVPGKYTARTFSHDLGLPELGFIESKTFFKDMLFIFPDAVKRAFSGKQQQFAREARFVRDEKGYSIGPHTDVRWKVLSLLFYLPPDDTLERFGTHLYRPYPGFERTPEDTNAGRHYPFEPFEDIGQMPFLPNSCFGFWRTEDSWHGVPEIAEQVRRDVLLYNIYTSEEQKPDDN